MQLIKQGAEAVILVVHVFNHREEILRAYRLVRVPNQLLEPTRSTKTPFKKIISPSST